MKFQRPDSVKDDGHAHIQFGQDPNPNLSLYGYCVVENVFAGVECTDTINAMWNWLEGLGTGIDRNDKSTWNNDNWPINRRGGMIYHTIAHEDFLWKLREHSNVIRCYEQIYKTKKLLSSFDGVMIGRPPEDGYTKSMKTSWIHCDQDLSNILSIQGIATFENIGDDDASLYIAEKSHLIQGKLLKKFRKKINGNFILLTEEEVNYLTNNGYFFTKVNAPAGSFILFNSKCFHQGVSHNPNRENPVFRYIAYITLAPASYATPKDIQVKINAIKKGRLTTHWPAKHVKLMSLPNWGSNVEYIKRKENIPDYENWSLDRKCLAGLIPYTRSIFSKA